MDINNLQQQKKGIIWFCLNNKLFVAIAVLLVVGWGMVVSPFDFNITSLPRESVSVDAIPDLGENQQIVFTKWPGKSPTDVQDQITYPLTVALLGVPEVKAVRSSSMFGFSSITVIFNESAEFYWARSRIVEKLNSIAPGTLPDSVKPVIGPDATALGQIFWYTLEGYDEDGNQTGGWDLQELRSLQDWKVRYELSTVEGVSEVASIGGFVKEYQIEVDPDALHAHGVTIESVFKAVQMSNADVGARTLEFNSVEYVIRGLGFIKSIEDIENTVVKTTDNIPISVKDVATVSLGPALRRGILDKEGAEAVGGVVVVRYGANPMEVIKKLREKIEKLNDNIDSIMVDGKKSSLRVVPFYDRTKLINETVGTLKSALTEEIIITVVVVIFMLIHLQSSILISSLLPIAVLMCFIAMKFFNVDANIVALSGIAIAIGTMVDMGIIICENILKHLDESSADKNRLQVVFEATKEVSSAVITAIATTVVSFLPVFMMTGESGKLYKPLAFTKTFALMSSVIVALIIIPPLAHFLFKTKYKSKVVTMILGICLLFVNTILGLVLIGYGIYSLATQGERIKYHKYIKYSIHVVLILVVLRLLSKHWMPLGYKVSLMKNYIFVVAIIGTMFAAFSLFIKFYYTILICFLRHKLAFFTIPTIIILFGFIYVWQGPQLMFGDMPAHLKPYFNMQWDDVKDKSFNDKVSWTLARDWKGRGTETRPRLDEGSFLLMPVTMPHASIGEAYDILQKQDKAIKAIPEIETVVGKIGRADSPLDPAPVSMIETVIMYKSEYITDEDGHVLTFAVNYKEDGTYEYIRDENNELKSDPDGMPFRQWGEDVKSDDDIWNKISKAAKIPGVTTASKLQPIETRLVMLQTGIRSKFGLKILGDDLKTIEKTGEQIELLLKEVESVDPNSVFADRIEGKPYLEIKIDRKAITRYKVKLQNVQNIIETAIGGKQITMTVEKLERYPVRVRYPRELRGSIEDLGDILVPSTDGQQIPLKQLTNLDDPDDVFVRGPQVIKGESAQLVGYVVFSKKEGYADVDVVRDCEAHLLQARRDGRFKIVDKIDTNNGVSNGEQMSTGIKEANTTYEFIVNGKTVKEFQKDENRLNLMLAVALVLIFMILYNQFKSIFTTLSVFSAIGVAWAGGFIMIWLYAQPWFLDFNVFGMNIRDLFQMHTINMSTAIWVGFLALFGIATDDGVVIATYLRQSFATKSVETVDEIREAVAEAGLKRVRPCIMTTATTLLALIPVLTSTGKGSDIMVPMAIPSFGGMTIALITLFVVPVLYCMGKEWQLFYKTKMAPLLSSIKTTAPSEDD